MFQDILPLLLDKWDQILPDTKQPNHLVPVLLSHSRVVLFLYDGEGEGASPIAVIKMWRTPKNNPKVERYVARCQMLRGFLDVEMLKTIPNCVLLGQVYGLNCVAETIVSGRSVKIPGRKFQDERIREDIEAVANWLTTFHKQTTIERWFLDQSFLEEQILTRLRSSLASHGDSRQIHDFTNAIADRLVGKSLLHAWRYGDSNPTNFFLQGGQVSGAFDLTTCGPNKWPLYDWFEFIFYYALFHCKTLSRRKHLSLEDARAALNILLASPQNPLGQMLRDTTRKFLDAQGLEQNMFPGLFAGFLTTLGYQWDVGALVCHALPYLMTRIEA